MVAISIAWDCLLLLQLVCLTSATGAAAAAAASTLRPALAFLAPDMDDSSHGGEANALSTTLIPSLAKVGVTDFAVGATIRVPTVVNGSKRWNETDSGQFSDVCTSERRPWQACSTGNCTPCNPLKSTVCRTCFFPRLLGAVGIKVMPQLYFFSSSSSFGVADRTEPPWACTADGQISDGHCNPMKSTLNPSAAAFSWFDDAFWADVAATFASAASFTCASGGRAITLDQEGYFGYMRCPNSSSVLPWGVKCSVYYGNQTTLSGPFPGNSVGYPGVIRAWNWLPNSSVTHGDRLAAAVQRGRAIARAAASACPGISIDIYSPESDLTDLAWMAGLATPEVDDAQKRSYNITKINRWGSPYYRDREEPADVDVVQSIREKWDYIAQEHQVFGLTAEQASTLLSLRGGVAIWSTVYYERRYLGTCCDLYNASALMRDKFDFVRAYETSLGRLAYFDIDPAFADAEVLQLQQLADVVGLYPGVRDYACVSGGSYCHDGDNAVEWNHQAKETFPDTRLCYKKGQPSCYSTVYQYFSAATLDTRARRIADAIASLRSSTPLLTANQPQLPHPLKVNGTQTWTVAQLELPAVLPADWRRTTDESGRAVLQTAPTATVAAASASSLIIYTPGTAYDITSARSCVDSTKCGGGAPVVQDDVYLELELYVDRSRGFGDTLLVEGVQVCTGTENPCAQLADKAWGWVRVRRQYLQSVHSSLVVTAPSAGARAQAPLPGVRIGGVRYISAASEPKLRQWENLALQMWLTGRGWERTNSGSLTFNPSLPTVTKELSFTGSMLALPGMPLVSASAASADATHMEMCVDLHLDSAPDDTALATPQAAKVQFQPIGNDPRIYRNGGGVLNANTSGVYRVVGQFCFGAMGSCTGRYGPNWRVAIYPVPGTVSFTLRRVTLVDGKAPCPPPLKTDDDGASMVVGTADHLLFDDFFTQTRNNLELRMHPSLLSEIKLQHYGPALARNCLLDLETLSYTSDDCLSDLGLPKGPRVKLRTSVATTIALEQQNSGESAPLALDPFLTAWSGSSDSRAVSRISSYVTVAPQWQ